jgi:hypothetical protein
MALGIEAGQAFVKFLLDDKEFKKGLSDAATKLKKFGAIGLAASAPIAAGFGAAARVFTQAGDELAKMSTRTGLSVESLSELKYAADQSGTSLGDVEKATKKMQLGILDAARGSGTLYEALGFLGINLNELERLTPEQQFLKLSRAVADVEDPTLKAALAQKVFGKSGTALLPMLADGSTGLDSLRQRAHDLGLTMDTETANAAVDLGDNIDDLKKQVMQMAIEIGAAVAGPLTEFAKTAQGILKWVIDFLKNNPALVRAIGYITAAIGAASLASITFGTILGIISAHPIIAALAAIATLALLVANYFGLIGDNGKKMRQSLDEIKGVAATVPKSDQHKLDAQSVAIQEQLQAAVSQTQTNPGATAAGSIEAAFVRRSLEEIAKNTLDTAKGIKELVHLATTGEAGFFASNG